MLHDIKQFMNPFSNARRETQAFHWYPNIQYSENEIWAVIITSASQRLKIMMMTTKVLNTTITVMTITKKQ